MALLDLIIDASRRNVFMRIMIFYDLQISYYQSIRPIILHSENYLCIFYHSTLDVLSQSDCMDVFNDVIHLWLAFENRRPRVVNPGLHFHLNVLTQH